MNKFKIWTEMSSTIDNDVFIAVLYQDLDDPNKTFNCAFSIDDDFLDTIENIKLSVESVILKGHPPVTMEMQ